MTAKDILPIIKSRKTTYEFSKKAVPESAIKKILEAGRWSPSSGNAQPWLFILTKSEDKIISLMDAAYYGEFHDPPSLMVIPVIAAKKYESHLTADKLKISERERMLSLAMAAYSMILEAESLGIQSCLLTAHEEELNKIISLEPYDQAPLIIGFGYEKKGAFQKKRYRQNLNDVIKQLS